MCLYLDLGVIRLPSYGVMITIGIILANLLAILLCKRYRLDGNDFIILEAYAFLGGFLGAKLLYLVVSFSQIDWGRIFEFDYFNRLMQGGFVFYGGLLWGIATIFAAGRLHHIVAAAYVRHMIGLIPLIHGFGRIGCFLAGCCYGRPYDGRFAVTFLEGSLAPSGIPLFPVQLTEALLLFLLGALILIADWKWQVSYTVELYLSLYGIIRFVLEYFRYDAVRGSLWIFSTSQWISIGLILWAVISVAAKITKSNDRNI